MIPTSLSELDLARDECYKMVTKRAVASGASAVVPLPGVDIAADVLMLMELLPAINRRFGLEQDQLDKLDHATKLMVFEAIKRVGSKAIGSALTKQIVAQLLKRIAGRQAAKQVLKYVPFAGQAAAAGISVAGMKVVGNSHVDECYAICRTLIEQKAGAEA